jgi:U3 small nucleolar RNA-associated protein 10
VPSSHVHTADVDDDSDPKPTQGVPGSASAFYAVLLCETLGEMKRVEASAVPRLLPYLEAGLAPAASAEQYAGALMVACQLSMGANMAMPLTEAVLEGVAKGARAPLHAQALQALLVICGSQMVRELPSRAFKHLVKMPDLPSRVADMCEKYESDSFIVPLVKALAQSATQHANYERVLGGIVDEVKLSELAVRALVGELVTLGSGSGADSAAATPAGAEHGREVAARSIRLVDLKHPTACSSAVDSLLHNFSKPTGSKDGDEGTNDEKKAANEEKKAATLFLREALAGSAAGPLPGHAASLGAALDHPTAGLREAALRELRNSGAASKVMSGGARKLSNAPPAPGVISGALLRRVTDDVPRVASLAAALPGLRIAVGDDEALFAAAVERLRVASAQFVGKNETAELERGVAKKLVKLACGTLSLPFPRASQDGTNADAAREESDSEAEESDSEADPVVAPAAVEDRGALGNLAGRAAGLALGHMVFSPATRAVARATIAAAKRNLHPSLAELRTNAFDEALARAQDAPEPPAKGKKGKKETSKGDTDSAALKEARARSDAAANAVVLSAVAKGVAAGAKVWGEGELTLWALEAWRDGSSGARANLLLVMREAVELDADGSVRQALWAVLRDSWREEGGAADFSDAGASDENLDVPITADVVRAIARNNPRVTPPLARSALHRLMQTMNGVKNGKKIVGVPASDASAGVIHEAFAEMSIADGAGGKGRFAASFDALLGAVERGGGSPVGFLATRAASDPSVDSTEVPQTALELLATRGADKLANGVGVLAVLTVACTASEPTVRSAAANAIRALAPSGTKGTDAVWKSLKNAANDVGSVTKSVDASAALCDALAAGVAAAGSKDESDAALREILAPLASLGISDDVSHTTGDEPRLGAYGGRRLVAALKDAGSDAGKADALAPALRWCLAASASSIDAAELAVEILETFTVEYAVKLKGGGLAESWKVFTSALVAPSPAPARVAAICRATPDFVDALPADKRIEILRVLFTAVGADNDAGARAAARDAIDAVKLHANDVVHMVRAAAVAAEKSASPSKRVKGSSAEGSSVNDDVGLDAIPAAIAALEVVGWKSPGDVESRADLAGPCQELLVSLLDASIAAREASSGGRGEEDEDDVAPSPSGGAASGYSQAVVLSTLDMLARHALGPDSAPFNKTQGKKKGAEVGHSGSTFDVGLVVRAVTEAEAGPAREAALALLAAVAKNDARGVMDHVLEVSAALAHRASNASDDPTAQRALEQALEAVVPAWIEGGFGVSAAAEQVVNALPNAPEHRRAPLCLALLRACPEGEGLPVVLLLLLGQLKKLEEAASASAAKRAKKAAKAAEKAGGRIAAAIADFEEDNTFAESAAWVLDLAGMLLSRETASGAVDALVATMKVRISPRHFPPGFFPGFGFAPAAGLVSLMIHS